jgi:hypothetical protein
MIDKNKSMKRRSVIKTLGALTLAGMTPAGLVSCSGNRADKEVFCYNTDILVIGGGTAGVVAAIQSGKTGCRTTLLEYGSQLGGTVTTGGVSFPGLFHAWGKQVIGGIGWELVSEAVAINGDTLPDFTIPFGTRHPRHQVHVNPSLYALLAEEKCLQAGVNIRYYETPVAINREGNKWIVDYIGKGTTGRIVCNQLIDCTGNAFAVSLAGFPLLRETEIQPGSLIFELSGFDIQKLDVQKINALYQKALQDGILLHHDVYGGIIHTLGAKGGLASQHVLNADTTTSESHTIANIEGRKSLLRIIRFVKTLPGCEKAYISKMQPETAVRETYRIDGLYRITKEDFVEGRIFDDSLSYSYYPIDLHVKEGVKPKHLQEGKVATVPLRALIPKGSENLIVAGRCVSSDRLANSALRVQASCMGMGQAAGATAVLAFKNNATPANIPVEEIKQLIKSYNGIVPL